MGVPERAFLNRRRSQRASIDLSASVVTMRDYQFFDIVDLSSTGARLTGPVSPPTGKTALFRLGEFQTLCRVVWVRDRLCGVHFDEPIHPRVLARLRDAGSAAEVGLVEPAAEARAAFG